MTAIVMTTAVVLFGSTVFAASSAPDANPKAVENLNKLLEDTRSLRANFSQKLTKLKDSKTQNFQGKFSLQRPNRFNWKITSPDKQLLVADGKNLWFYDEDLEQVTVSPLADAIGSTPAVLLSSSAIDVDKQFYVLQTKNDGKVQEFTLNPKQSDQLIEKVTLTFVNNTLSSMVFIDSTGQKSEIKFTSVEMNPTLPASLFTFKAPTGVDVIGKPR